MPFFILLMGKEFWYSADLNCFNKIFCSFSPLLQQTSKNFFIWKCSLFLCKKEETSSFITIFHFQFSSTFFQVLFYDFFFQIISFRPFLFYGKILGVVWLKTRKSLTFSFHNRRWNKIILIWLQSRVEIAFWQTKRDYKDHYVAQNYIRSSEYKYIVVTFLRNYLSPFLCLNVYISKNDVLHNSSRS